MKETVNIMSEDHLGISTIDEKHCVGGESVDCQVCHVQISVPDATCDQDDALVSDEINICGEFSQSLSLNAEVQKCLSKCKTFCVSKEMQGYCLSINGTAEQGQNSSASGTSVYSRSISLPSSSTLISAMNGGRALNGTLVRSELRVKWAPEVYDPPATSMSHVMNGHQTHCCRPKANKKEKHKNKGKSSRGSGRERKHGNLKSSYPQNVRLQGNDDKLVLNGFGQV